MSVAPPSERTWWEQPVAYHEKIWLVISVITGVFLFFMMPFWHLFGHQNSSAESYRVNPQAFYQRVQDWTRTQQQTPQGLRPAGNEVYIVAYRFAWFPNPLVLKAGVEYRIHLSSRDVNHGFSLHRDGTTAQKVNFQVVPGYDYVLTMRFTEPGTYHLVCQEYCGLSHQIMVGKIIVEG